MITELISQNFVDHLLEKAFLTFLSTIQES